VVEDSGNPGEFLTFDLIGADWMQQRWELAAEGLASSSWREALLRAPVAILELNTRRLGARALLHEWSLEEEGWYEIFLLADPAGGGQLYRNMFGAVIDNSGKLPPGAVQRSKAVVSLGGSIASSSKIQSLLPTAPIDHLCIYDVGKALSKVFLMLRGSPLPMAIWAAKLLRISTPGPPP
jgi:hypothetical protein